ncbi:MAG: hypothetical protein ACTS27_08590 [Phycisphaerales bacterium]
MRRSVPLVAAHALAAVAFAGPLTATFNSPSLDRWNYPFNPSPGTRTTASLFGTAGYTEFEFDDRDALFLIGFDTAGQIPAGEDPERYRITSAVVTATIAFGDAFRYDPTDDSYRTHLDETDPEFMPDADAGRPIELFGAAFRNGFTAATFLENSPHGPSFGLGVRNSYATDYVGFDPDAMTPPRDVGNNVKDRFDPAPFAIGITVDAAVGGLVPSEAVFTFTVDLSNPAAVAFLRDGLAQGRLRFQLSSLLFPSFIGPPQAGDRGMVIDYPIFYTKEDKFAKFFDIEPTLSIAVELVDPLPGDTNGDGVVNFADLNTVLTQFGQSGAGLPGDVTGDGIVNFSDLNLVLTNFGTTNG